VNFRPDQYTVFITFSAYLLAMAVIGFAAYRRTRGLSDFVLGGRRLGSWVAALSAGASDMSGWLLLGLPGFAYVAGLESLWLALGLALGTWANWRFVASRLRVYSELAGDALTLPAFFGERFEDSSGRLRLVSAAFTLLFFLFYTASGLVAGGKLFETVFGLPYLWAVGLGAAAIILYTSLGGFIAVAWTDLVQALLMALALILVPLMTFDALGGLGPALARIDAANPALLSIWTDASNQPLTVVAVVSLLAWGLGYFGQPHILARFKALSSEVLAARARRIAVGWVMLTLVGAILVGLAGIPWLDPALSDADSEKVFLLLVNALFHPVPAGICLAAVLAAIMSTADSQLLVSSSTFTEDFYQRFFRRRASQRELVSAGRLSVVVIALIAFALALDPASKVLDLVAYAWAGFGAAFGPALLLSLYWRRMTALGAFAGIVSGGLTVVAWKQLSGGVFDLYEMVPGVAVSTLAIVLASLADRAPSAEVVATFDAVHRRVAGSRT
jgi:sodium/proline symporter